jgi:hypothetical protein
MAAAHAMIDGRFISICPPLSVATTRPAIFKTAFRQFYFECIRAGAAGEYGVPISYPEKSA